jgi:7-cyano-7-deazaguanine synthase in queuosine biosynthesis
MSGSNYQLKDTYTLVFDSDSNQNLNIHFQDHTHPQSGRRLTLNIDDSVLRARRSSEYPEIVADIVDLAGAIYAADRISVPHESDKFRSLRVVLPVRCPDIFKDVSNSLTKLLNWATGCRWDFEFGKRTTIGRSVEYERVLPFHSQDREFALWSGGLDALAGVVTRSRELSDLHFGLVGLGSNGIVSAQQRDLVEHVGDSLRRRLNLFRLPIRLYDKAPQDKKNKKYSYARSRGVVFALLGAACAYLQGQKSLSIYENGVGAINLPFRNSEISLDHTRSAHPLTLMLLSQFLSKLFGESFCVKNPFLFWTKAQMLAALVKDKRTDLPPLTTSCDSRYREWPYECGYCSSCLLRRQALIAAELGDLTKYMVPHGLSLRKDPSTHLRAMLVQVERFEKIFKKYKTPDTQWVALVHEYPELDDIVDRTTNIEALSTDDMRQRLINLYQRYSQEWVTARPILSDDVFNWDTITNKEASFKASTKKSVRVLKAFSAPHQGELEFHVNQHT